MPDLATVLGSKFIQRKDAKAIQMANGEYHLHTVDGKRESARLPWKMRDISAHLGCQETFGHYLLDAEDRCKFFAFDIDLEQKGFLPDLISAKPDGEFTLDFYECNPREAWLDRKNPGRPWIKSQMRMLGEKLARVAHEDLSLPVAIAYSGAKGLHVYCFTGTVPAAEAREGAELVLETLGEFELYKGQHFFKHKDTDPYTGYPNFSVEVFPKQTTLDGKDLGNLMRLPLGRNRKTDDPTFFLDCKAPPNELRPLDPMTALVTGDPWL